MKEKFIEKRFNNDSLVVIKLANGILEEYGSQGFRLTLRQLYYQMVARGHIENSQKSYKRIGSIISDGRQAGLIDWRMIEDRNRNTRFPPRWESPADIVRAAAEQFGIDKWIDQNYHIEVMVEKDALSGVLEPVCLDLNINFTANKGYSSSSMMYFIGKRIQEKHDSGKEVVIIYLGDHDPSGIDMTRDITERLGLYSWVGSEYLIMERIALNWDQIQLWNPPENPAKTTDSRYSGYVDKFGESSWELDAVDPATLKELLEKIVGEYRDDFLWDAQKEKEDEMIRDLISYADKYKKDQDNK